MITEGICLKYILYRVMRTIFSPIFRILFRPRIIGAQNIPQDGAAVIAGNHKHALDPILIDISTKRVVRTLAKKNCTTVVSVLFSVESELFPLTSMQQATILPLNPR